MTEHSRELTFQLPAVLRKVAQQQSICKKKPTHNYVSLFVTENSPGTKEEKGGILAHLLQVVFILIVC